ncbi:MAG: hypothetical protein JSV44_02280, partial [Candidatus Zixiibacteriota bacterium]
MPVLLLVIGLSITAFSNASADIFYCEIKPLLKADSILLLDNWRYHEGDSGVWANPEFDDSGWKLVGSYGLVDSLGNEWKGIAWLRLNLIVDSSFWGKTAGISWVQAGASEVYLNGKQIYSFGKV